MKKNILLIIVFFCQWVIAQNFDTYFEQGALRIDFYLSAQQEATHITFAKLKKEPYFAGSKTNLIHPKYGACYVQIKDKKTQQIIYAQGLSPIFYEWMQLPQSKQTNKIFENVFRMPYPKADIIFEYLERKQDGTLALIFSKEIKITDYQILKEQPDQYNVVDIYRNAPVEKAVDLVFVAEGYTQEQMPKFITDAKRLVDYMFSVSPFSDYSQKFNVYAIESPSQEAGTDIGGQGVYKNTILNSHFYTFDSERYLTAPSVFKLADISANAPCDQVYVLVNTERYGGGGFYNVMNLVSSDHALSDKVFVHEFGHGFVALADEYYYENDVFSPNEAHQNYLKYEPWEQNITTLVDFQSKWADLVSKKTPIPTPRTHKYNAKVGAFEGGGYHAKGVYSPMQDCRMKSNDTDIFCPVCHRTIVKAIELYIN